MTHKRRIRLTPREATIIEYVANGLTDKAIAEKLAISKRTVSCHMANILRRTNAVSRTQAVAIWIRA